MPLSALLFLEELALGNHSLAALGHPPVHRLGIVALTYARLFIVVIITGMRMIDVERAMCKGVNLHACMLSRPKAFHWLR